MQLCACAPLCSCSFHNKYNYCVTTSTIIAYVNNWHLYAFHRFFIGTLRVFATSTAFSRLFVNKIFTRKVDH